MRDSDTKLIWEAYDDDVVKVGVLKEDMIIIVMDTPIGTQGTTGAVILRAGSGRNKIFTRDEAESYMIRMTAKPDVSEDNLHAGIMAKKGTRVEVFRWGPEDTRFLIRMLEPIEMSERPNFVVQDDQLTKYRGEELEDVIARWVDFSKISNTKSRLKGLR